jgi:hypothetical protein
MQLHREPFQLAIHDYRVIPPQNRGVIKQDKLNHYCRGYEPVGH